MLLRCIINDFALFNNYAYDNTRKDKENIRGTL